ncbi:MAG: hypothetical protein DMG48_05520 [Acidobacteria bacterium]|nr:MAG: hypothetical protein DMG48_05520 [Acidobacteriota bacterium]
MKTKQATREPKKAAAPKKAKSERKSQYDNEKIVAMYKKGHSIPEIMKEVGCSYPWARWQCVKAGVFKPGSKNKEAK